MSLHRSAKSTDEAGVQAPYIKGIRKRDSSVNPSRQKKEVKLLIFVCKTLFLTIPYILKYLITKYNLEDFIHILEEYNSYGRPTT